MTIIDSDITTLSYKWLEFSGFPEIFNWFYPYWYKKKTSIRFGIVQIFLYMQINLVIIIKIKCNVFVLKWSVCVFFLSSNNALFKEGITLETFNLTPDDLSICTYKSSQNSNICKLNHKFVDEKESQTWFSCIVKLVSAKEIENRSFN